MKNCAFTIVAKNYIGLAQILEASIRQYYNDLSFYIIVADEISADLKEELPLNVLIAKECLALDSVVWNNLSFKYNLTEFCTSIKPLSCIYFFENYEFDNVIYLDPDIYFFDSIKHIYDLLSNYSIMLTPHITQLPKIGESDSPETIWHSCGMYNLGFCGLHRSESTMNMLKWWHDRLLNSCYIDSYNFLFTDQKWMDFLPSFFSSNELLVSFNLGMNVAPWNFYEREVFSENQKLFVRKRYNGGDVYPLIFVHYSGYDYKELKRGNICQKNIQGIRDYLDIQKLTTIYSDAIQLNSDIFDHFISLDYSYNSFSDSSSIIRLHRRLYRALCDRGVELDNPFSQEGLFYSLLKSRNMIIKGKSNLDKLNKNNVSNVTKKLKRFNLCTKILYKILGFEKYFLFIRLLHPFSRLEAQIHLLDDKYMDSNLY